MMNTKTPSLRDQITSVESERTYIEADGVNIDRTISSLEALVSHTQHVFVDTSVFHCLAHYVTSREPETFDLNILQRAYAFKRGMTRLLAKYGNISLTGEVLDELKDMRRVSDEAFHFVTTDLHDNQNIAFLETEAYKALAKDHGSTDNLLKTAQRRKHNVRPGIHQETNRTLLLLLKDLDRKLGLKKEGSISSTDEKLVAAALTSAVVDDASITVISRDKDIFNLLRAGYQLLTSNDINHLRAREMRSVGIVEANFSPRTGTYFTKRVYSSLSDEPLEEKATAQEAFKTLHLRVLSLYHSLCDRISSEDEPRQQERFTRSFDARDKEHPIKIKTIHGGKFRQQSYTYTLDGRHTMRRNRDHEARGFSKRFKRDFGHLFPRYPFASSPRDFVREEISDKAILRELRGFIPALLPKYAQSSDPVMIEADREYAREITKFFLWNKKKLPGSGIPKEEMLDTCKQFIEYGLFLRSLYGDKFIPLSLRHFAGLRDDQGKLDYGRIGKDLDEVRDLFGVPQIPAGNPNALIPQFDTFIDYTLATRFSDQPPHPLFKERAHQALEEAVTKYRITQDNLDRYLKLALQHIEWGLNQASRTLRIKK